MGYMETITGVIATGDLVVCRDDGTKHAIQVIGRNAAGVATAPTACTVDLKGSLNGVDYFTLGTWAVAGGNSSITFVVDKPVTSVMATVATLTLGTATTVDVHMYGV